MSKKAGYSLVLVLALMGVLGVSINVHKVEAPYPIIFIKADGSIYPLPANITSSDNVTYTFTADINASIVVEKDNIIVDGAGYTLQGGGTGSGYGIDLSDRNNVTIQNTIIKNFRIGLYLTSTSFDMIFGNNITNNGITNNGWGISFGKSSNSTISGNNITNNDYGIDLTGSSNNTIFGNNITENNQYGIYLYDSSDNKFYHNNIDNKQQVYFKTVYANYWDDGVEGNYWSDYTGVDSNYDGIGDSWYNITQDNTDHYPLMGMFSDFLVTHQEKTYHVTSICNSEISEFQFNDIAKTISFNVTGPDYTLGLCRVTVPNIIVQDLWQGNYKVLVDGEEPIMMNNWTDGTYTYIYFKYLHSEHKVEITPEFPSFLILPLFMIATLLAVIVYRRKHTM